MRVSFFGRFSGAKACQGNCPFGDSPRGVLLCLPGSIGRNPPPYRRGSQWRGNPHEKTVLAARAGRRLRSTQPVRAAGRGMRPSGIPATLLASLVRSLPHAFEEGSLREPHRRGFQRTPRGDAPTHVAAQLGSGGLVWRRLRGADGLESGCGRSRPGKKPPECTLAREKGAYLAKNHYIARHDRHISPFCVH